MSNKRFALIGAAGFIAPRHLKAIKDTGNDLVAASDKFDSVGVIDSYFPNASFFTELERFDRHIEKLRLEKNNPVEYISICSPNYLHDFHIRMALRNAAHAICEKPLVLNPWNIDALEKLENEANSSIYNILQLRLHEKIVELKKKIEAGPRDKVYDIDLTYITSRGLWYYTSWKGEIGKSGGIATNIGVHFFDMLTWIFGPVKNNEVHIHEHDRASGYLELSQARIRWFLSINSNTLPEEAKKAGQRTYRSITIENEEIEFSQGFTELHTESYKRILEGKGFKVNEVRPSIEIVHDIRNQKPKGLSGEYHPFAKKPLEKHPFRKNNKLF